jgi:PPM family protein phosphatase
MLDSSKRAQTCFGDFMNPKVSAFGISHVGRVRARNEDCILIDPEGQYAVLADGMGGHKGGQEASRMTVEIVSAIVNEILKEGFPANEALARAKLRAAFQSAATQVAHRGQEFPELDNMGTTLVLWLAVAKNIYIVHVGDSRCYLFRKGELFQLTMDHTLENEQVKLGLPREQAMTMPMRAVLSRNIGLMPPSEPDIAKMPWEADDVFLLCSDGLSNRLSHDQIRHRLQLGSENIPSCCKALVEQAWMQGGEDNISVVLLQHVKV